MSLSSYPDSLGKLDEKSKSQTVKKRSHSYNLMRVDDICKTLIIDPLLGFDTRKICENTHATNNVQAVIEALIRNCFPINESNFERIKISILELLNTHDLFMKNDISADLNLMITAILTAYLRLLSTDSLIALEECNRYRGDQFKGTLIKAKVDLPKNSRLEYLIGFMRPITEKTRKVLESKNLDFSIMRSNMTNSSIIMLGPAAFINHSCNPNAEYYSISKHVLIIKTTKDVKAGEEIFSYYGSNYFGENNRYCECTECELNCRGYFNKPTENPSPPGTDLCKCREQNNTIGMTNDLAKSTFCHSAVNMSSTNIEGIVILNEIINFTLEPDEPFLGFSNYKKLDKKLDLAYVQLEKIDVCQLKGQYHQCNSNDQQTEIPSMYTMEYILEKKDAGYGFCIFCYEFKTQLPRHLKLMHKDKDIVKYSLFDGDSYKPNNSATAFMRNQGLHHLEILTGIPIPAKKPKCDAKKEVKKKQCYNCLGYFSDVTLIRHQKFCLKFTISSFRNFSRNLK